MTKFKPIEKGLSSLSESANKIMAERYFNEEDVKKFSEADDEFEQNVEEDYMYYRDPIISALKMYNIESVYVKSDDSDGIGEANIEFKNGTSCQVEIFNVELSGDQKIDFTIETRFYENDKNAASGKGDNYIEELKGIPATEMMSIIRKEIDKAGANTQIKLTDEDFGFGESKSEYISDKMISEDDNYDDDDDDDDDDDMIVERFRQIQSEIIDLAGEALDIIPEHLKNRARSYWYGQILAAAGDSEYAGSSMHSMEDTAEELQESADFGESKKSVK